MSKEWSECVLRGHVLGVAQYQVTNAAQVTRWDRRPPHDREV